MPKSVSTRSAYKMLTCIYLCRTLLFFAPYADFSMKNCVMFISTYSIYEDLNSMYEEWSLLFKQTQHTK